MGVFPNHDCTLDGATQLKDAGLVAATADSAVSGSTVTLDFGAAGIYQKGRIIIDTTAVEVATGDEVYNFQATFSSTSDFSTRYITASKLLGATTPTGHPVATAAVGRHVIYCDNVCDTSATTQSATPMRYMRLRCVVAGSIATGINYTAWFVPDAS